MNELKNKEQAEQLVELIHAEKLAKDAYLDANRKLRESREKIREMLWINDEDYCEAEFADVARRELGHFLVRFMKDELPEGDEAEHGAAV